MKNRDRVGLYFVLPWVIGFTLFTVFPMIFAFYIGLTDWTIIGDANFIGLDNYVEALNSDMFRHSLFITIRFALYSIPIGLVLGLLSAVLLNSNVKGIGVFRVIYYMPAIVSGVAVAVVFKWILDPNFGLINGSLAVFGIDGPDWLYDPDWVTASYLLMSIWGAAAGYLVYLASIKDVPRDLYESAEIDGANSRQKLLKVTVPLLSPIIFYNLVMGVIGSLRKFSDAYVLGGAGGEGRFYMVYLYEEAFMNYNMGYATALAWILFIITMMLTAIVMFTKKYWVHT